MPPGVNQHFRGAGQDGLGSSDGLLGGRDVSPDREHQRLEADRHGLATARADLGCAPLAQAGCSETGVQVRPEAQQIR